jgi:uncharacterized membrane protein YgdD (TMEM256/DUF423 family)
VDCILILLSLTKHGENKMRNIFYTIFIGIILFVGYLVVINIAQNMINIQSNRIEIINQINT